MEEIQIKCPDCEYEWTYKGKRIRMIEQGKRVYVTCPSCKKNVKIEKE
jgi:endogenous inhibitor of DNA gyrase (YacG/DUF329 family)